MDGFEFVAELSKREEWRKIPVAVVTAKDLSLEDRLRLNGYVEKIIEKGSYSREKLLSEVREITLLDASSDEDALPPRELTPAFFGCYDWHSSVHGHWLLARLARRMAGRLPPGSLLRNGMEFGAEGNFFGRLKCHSGSPRRYIG